jgi:hypothetical protein
VFPVKSSKKLQCVSSIHQKNSYNAISISFIQKRNMRLVKSTKRCDFSVQLIKKITPHHFKLFTIEGCAWSNHQKRCDLSIHFIEKSHNAISDVDKRRIFLVKSSKKLQCVSSIHRKNHTSCVWWNHRKMSLLKKY